MKNKKLRDKHPVDSDGRRHGLCEVYYPNGKLACRGRYVHGSGKGLCVWYDYDDSVYEKTYYL